MASYASVILAEPGLAAYWKLDEPSGTTAADSAPTPDNGTYVNTPTLGGAGPVVVNTPSDKAASLTRTSSQEVTIPDANKLDMTTALTIEAWVKPATNPAAGEFRTIFAKLATSLVNGDYDLEYTNTGGTFQLNGEIQGGSGFSLLFNLPGALSTTSWSHVAMTWDGSNMRCYLNGAIIGSPTAASTSMTANAVAATIGRYGGGTNADYWNGGIGHVAIYNVALSAAALLDHYTVGTTPDSAVVGVSGRSVGGVRNRRGPMSGPRWLRPRNAYLITGGGFVDSAVLTWTGDFNDSTTAFGTLDIDPGTSAFSLAGDWTGNGVVDISGVSASLSGDFAWLGQGVVDFLLNAQALAASFDVTGAGSLDISPPAAALGGDFNSSGAGTVDAFLAAVAMSGDFNWTGIGVLDSALAAQALSASFDVTGIGTLINQLTAGSLSADFNWSGAGVLDVNAPVATLSGDFNWSGIGVLDELITTAALVADFNMSGFGTTLLDGGPASHSADFNWAGNGVVDMVPPTGVFDGTDFFWSGIGDIGAFVDSAILTLTAAFGWTGTGFVDAFLAAAGFAADTTLAGAGTLLTDPGSAALAASLDASGAGTLLAVASASALDSFGNLQGAGFLVYDIVPANLDAQDFIWTGIGDTFTAGSVVPGSGVRRGWIEHNKPHIDRSYGKVAR